LKAQLFIQHQRDLAVRKRDEKTKLDFQKAAILSEFREQLRKGGQINVDDLAKKYKLDIEELRRRVEQEGRDEHTKQTGDDREGAGAQ
jgi:hypothetical protein